jgi:hypothetical protein
MVTSSRGGQAGAGRAEWLQKARAHLRDADPVLAGLIADRPDFDPRREVLLIAGEWRPYRSLATAYLFSAAFDEAGARRPCGAERPGGGITLIR